MTDWGLENRDELERAARPETASERQLSDDAFWGSPAQPADDWRGDGRDDALASYELDDASRETANRLGVELGQRVPPELWASAPVEARLAMCDEMYEVIASETAPNADRPTAFHEADGPLGRIVDGHVEIERDVIDNPDITEALETLAHEYRHLWQMDVIQGDAEGDVDEDLVRYLDEGSRTYASADNASFTDYAWNHLEIDSEKFARAVSHSYETNRPRR